MTISKTVKQEIREAVGAALDFNANWTGDDYVGYICDREGINIDSPEINSIVFEAMSDYEMGLL